MTRPVDSGGAWPRGWDEHRRSRADLGLRLTPAERLRWLEETMETMRRWLGRARAGATAAPPRAEPSDRGGAADGRRDEASAPASRRGP